MPTARELLLKKRNRRTKIVTIDSKFPDADLRGQRFCIRSMTAGERAVWESQFTTPKGKPILERQQEIRERLCIACLVDEETGAQLLEPEDLPALREVDAALLEAIVKGAQELNDISDDDLAALEKN